MAGDPELGAAYAEAVAPMVWTAAGRPDFVADVQAMRRRVEEHVRPDHADRELKLGRGGLRDVEFAVQLLQLVHGRADPALRSPTTLMALGALADGGYVGRDDGANLAASYRFLRLLEHRLQLQRMRRTHLLPAENDTDALRWLARAASCGRTARHDAVGVLLEEWRRTPGGCAGCTRSCSTGRCSTRRPGCGAEAALAAGRRRPARARWASPPEAALDHIAALTGGVSRAAAIQKTCCRCCSTSLPARPTPTAACSPTAGVRGAADTPWYLRLLRDEGPVAERLMTLLGIRAGPGPARPGPRGPAPARRARRGAARRADPEPAAPPRRCVPPSAAQPDPHAAAAAARSARRHEMLRIACADLLGQIDVEQVAPGSRRCWVAVLQAVLASAAALARPARPRPARIAVIGMGRLGGAELGYGCDADVLFVCEPTAGRRRPRGGQVRDHGRRDGAPPARRARARTRRWSSTPTCVPRAATARWSGPWRPTASTTPGGREPWEAQALLRARPVAGDAELGRRFIELVDPIRYPDAGLTPAAVTEIRRIKARVDAERLPRGADRATHTKLGRGGLADVEWTVQLLQLQHAGDIPELRTTATLDGLREAAEADLITHEDADELRRRLDDGHPGAQRDHARARQAGGPAAALGRELAAVAAALGYPPDGDPGVSSTTTGARPAAPAPWWSGCSTAGDAAHALLGRPTALGHTGAPPGTPCGLCPGLLRCARRGLSGDRAPPAAGYGAAVPSTVAPARVRARRRRARRHPRTERALHRRPRARARPPRRPDQRRRQHDRRRADRRRGRPGGRRGRDGVGRGVRRCSGSSARRTSSTSACRPSGTAATSPPRSAPPPGACPEDHRHSGARRRSPGGFTARRVFWQGVAVGATNPKVLVLFVALLPQFTDPDAGRPGVQMLVLGLLFTLIAAVLDSVWGLAAGSARDWLATSPARLRRVGGTGGLMLIGLGATLALTGRRD